MSSVIENYTTAREHERRGRRSEKPLKGGAEDLAAERTELAELKKYDPQRMRKNLDASKKKLAEKTTAADKLQKYLSEARSENSQLELKIKELEAQLEATTAEQDGQVEKAKKQPSRCRQSVVAV